METSREWPILEGRCFSSSSPISSKLVMSDSRLSSGLEKVEEYEDDFEEREPDSSGGEPGASVVVVVIVKVVDMFVEEVSERNSRSTPCADFRDKSSMWAQSCSFCE